MIDNRKYLVDILIPTMDNTSYLRSCILSILGTRQGENLSHLWVINNGHPNSCDWIDPKHKFITVIQTGGKNLGWEGAIAKGMEMSKAPFVVFQNDDTVIPYSDKLWLNKMIQHFRDPLVAAVGPTSNMVMGNQNMLAEVPVTVHTNTFLIGFCVMHRREFFEKIGGFDFDLPGGDDLDWSIRYRNAGYKLIVDRNVFVFHYGAQTGIRLHGNYNVEGGWYSNKMTENTNLALIKKHGLRKWWETLAGMSKVSSIKYNFKKDSEGILIRKNVKVKGLKVIDLGCGNLKTYSGSIGVDIVEKDKIIEQIGGDGFSVADITADVSMPLPIEDNSVDVVVARHVLEHMVDPISAVRHWLKPLRVGGRLVICIPNERLIESIPMNPQHYHAWVPESFTVFAKAVGGIKILDMWDSENQISFTSVLQKL